MSIYLQFDSSARSLPYIQKNISGNLLWVPNDNYPNSTTTTLPLSIDPYQKNFNAVQSPSRYRVFYKEMNTPISKKTISYLEHCKERPVNINYNVENCTVIVPASALVARIDPISGAITYVNVINEPYLYVRVMPITDSQGNLITSNNPASDRATFMVWHDKNLVGETNQPVITPAEPIDPDVSYIPGPAPPVGFPERPLPTMPTTNLNQVRWIVYKTCMTTVTQLDLTSNEWEIRIYDRYGNDLILSEADIGPGGTIGFPEPPNINPDVQTTVLVGIKPIYMS